MFTIVVILTFLIFRPFLTVLALSGMVAVIVGPLYRRLYKFFGERQTVAALATVLLVIIVILLPLALIGSKLILEAQAMYVGVIASPDVSIDKMSEVIQQTGQRIYSGFAFDIREYLSAFSAWIISNIGGIFSGTIDFVVKLVLGLVALFYFLRDGAVFKKHIISFSPFSEENDKHIITTLKSAINSVIVGSVVIALIQGLLAGIGFTIFGVPNATLWGTTAAIAAMIPGVGTALVWIPAVIYLFFAKASFAWIGLLIWSVLLVGLIDNFLGPKIIERGVNIHPLLILFSILGGITFFGPEGVLLGPLVLSLLFALVRVYQQGRSQNS